MHVFYLTTQFPWPATGGGPVRTLAQLKVLGSLPEVDSISLLSVTEGEVLPADCQALTEAVPKLRVLPPVFHPIHLWRFPRNMPRVLALRAIGVPYLAAKWDSKRVRQILCHELRNSAPDVVYVDHLGMAQYLPAIRAERPHAHVVIDQHNVESDFFKQFAESKNGVGGLIARIEWQAAARFEKCVLRTVDAVVAISRADASSFAGFGGVRANVVPVVMECRRACRPHPGRPHFCYVGSLRWRPNVAGLDWFCQTVWPRIRARLPDATMEIAGMDLESDARGMLRVPTAWRVPGVETVGFLKDLEPLYARSVAMVAPAVGGSGVRIKVLEGFRAGLPVVTTADGAFGLPLTNGENALIADDPDAFAEHAERLVYDEGLRVRLREEGYAYLENHHSMAIAQVAMREAIGLGSMA